MGGNIWLCFIFVIGLGASEFGSSSDGSSKMIDPLILQGAYKKKTQDTNTINSKRDPKCWMSLRAPDVFKYMDEINKEYETARKDAQAFIDKSAFDKNMLEKMLHGRGIAYREITKERPKFATIPAGLNLGGLCMMRMPYSLLFFHRMKLRNSTIFRINYLHTDIANMTLEAQLSLNTLNLTGAYDRSMTDKDPSVLIYSPTYGQVEVIMEDVQYFVEGRYRLIKDRLVVELIVSYIDAKNINLRYSNSSCELPTHLEQQHMEEFIARMKTDLDTWLLDYFNDYLIMTNLEGIPSISQIREYDDKKSSALGEFMEYALGVMNTKLRDLGGNNLLLPKFRIISSYNLTIELHNGTLRGLDTMYRRSIATTNMKKENVRFVDSLIGFSDLKVTYLYEIKFPQELPTPQDLTGAFIMSSNDLAAHLSLGLVKSPEMVQIEIDFLNRWGVESITMEGSANVMKANFKHLLHHEIASIMSNSLMYGIRLLETLPRCEPFIPGMLKKKSESKIVQIQPEDSGAYQGSSDSVDDDNGVNQTILRHPKNKLEKKPRTKKNRKFHKKF